MKFRMYIIFVLFPMIIVVFLLFTYKCFGCANEHVNPVSTEYTLKSLPFPSIGFTGGPYSPPASGGFIHTSSAYNWQFWGQVDYWVYGGISCGYRCPVRNSQLPNAAPKSFHMYGCTADVTGEPEEDLAPYFPYHKTEYNPLHVHIDWRTR